MAHKAVRSMTHCDTKDSHKQGKLLQIWPTMCHSYIVDHDEMKNNFHMKNSLNPCQFQNQNQKIFVTKNI